MIMFPGGPLSEKDQKEIENGVVGMLGCMGIVLILGCIVGIGCILTVLITSIN